MGVRSELVVAGASEADAIAAVDEPTSTWEGFSYTGLDVIKLMTLWALLESDSPNNRFEERLDSVNCITCSESGPWVDVLSPEAVRAFVQAASMAEEQFESVANAWAETEEFDGWEAEDVIDLLRSVGDLAESAVLSGKTLVLRTSM
jgi:hypothetical protein